MTSKNRSFVTSMFSMITIYFVTFSVIFFNITFIKSSLVGFVSSIIYVYISSVLCGNIFFKDEVSWHRILFGFFVFIVFLSFAGAVILALYRLTTTLILLILFGITFLLTALNVKIHGIKNMFITTKNVASVISEKATAKKLNFMLGRENIFQSLYLALVALCFLLLTISRSEETVKIWAVMHPAFLPFFFIATLLLLAVLLSKTRTGLKLFFILIHSLLVHSFLVIVLNPGLYGDMWHILGLTRDVVNTGKNVPSLFDIVSGEASLSGVQAIYFVARKRVHQALVPILANMFGVDIYWSQIFLTPVLWTLFVPFLIYKIVKALGGRESDAILGSFLSLMVPTLIWWGAITLPDTLGKVFFLLTVYLGLRFLSSRETGLRQTTLIFILPLVAFLTHFIDGILSFVVLFLVLSIKLYRNTEKISTKVLLMIVTILCTSLLPLSLFALGEVYPGASYMRVSFSLEKLYQTDVLSLIFGDYVNYPFNDVLAKILVPALGLVGFIYVAIFVPKRRLVRSAMLFLLLMEIVFLMDYRITKYGMLNVPFSAERMWVYRDLLILPFASMLGVGLLENFYRKLQGLSFHVYRRRFTSLGVISFVLVSSLITSGFAVLATTNAYTLKPIMNPTPYEVEAIQYIHRTTPEKYVVITDPVLVGLAYGIIGGVYSNYYIRESSFWWDMYSEPSEDILARAMVQTGSSVAYFVISIRYQRLFSSIVKSAQEIFETYAVFGDGNLYVFRYPPREQELAISLMVDSGIYSRINYPVEYELNFTQALLGMPHGHLDSNSISVINPNGFEVPASFEYFQVWFENCSSSDSWSDGVSDGDVLTFTAQFTNATPELRRLKYVEFERDGGNLTIDTTNYKYIEVKWKENYDNVVAVRFGFWKKTNDGWEGELKWAWPSPQWSIWSYDISFLDGTLAGLDFDVFDSELGTWNGSYRLDIDWIRFVSDTGTIRWLYNSTTSTIEEYRILYDFLENTGTDNLDGLPEKSEFVFNKNETIPPPSVSLMVPTSLVIKTVDLLGQPISDVTVEIKELGLSLTTDMDGLASFVVPQGQWSVMISRDGIINEGTIDVLLNSVSLQALSLIKIDGLVLDLWKAVLFGSICIVTCMFLLFLLHRKVIAGLTHKQMTRSYTSSRAVKKIE
jgi:hypothetical protein